MNKRKNTIIKQIWAPWRLGYVQNAKKEKKGYCLFCSKFRSKMDKKNYVIKRDKYSFALLNIFPYNNGHIMIAPNRHINDLEYLRQKELMDMINLLIDMKLRLKRHIHPHGFNIGINCGTVAGAGIPGHIHIHIVPRWNGDTNFMPLFSNIRVIPQSLNALYSLLTK